MFASFCLSVEYGVARHGPSNDKIEDRANDRLCLAQGGSHGGNLASSNERLHVPPAAHDTAAVFPYELL